MNHNTALILIDIQQGFDDPTWGTRNNPATEKNIEALLQYWRTKGWPVLHVQHCSVETNSPLHPESPGCNFKPEALPKPGEPIFQKSVNSAFIGTELETFLREKRITTLVVVGFTTDHCVSTTTRMAANLGFEAFVVSDATATFNRMGYDGREFNAVEIHSTALASLHGEFATVVRTEALLANY